MSCAGCRVQFGVLNWKYLCPTEAGAGGCGQYFCSKCLDYAVLSEQRRQQDLPPLSYCKGCFRQLSSLGFEAKVEVTGPAAGEAPAIVFVHGAGGCRKMFAPHARALALYRCVLLDLPGHGALMDEPLSLDSAIATIVDVTRAEAPPCRGHKPIYVGGSLGGYIGMELLGRHPDLFQGAVIAVAGQNTGPGRSFKAGAGLSLMRVLGPRLAALTMLNGMITQAKKNGHIQAEILDEIATRPGMYFHQLLAHLAILEASNPRVSLPRFEGAVLFVNGSLDHADSQDVWLAHARQGQLKVYEQADHFFSHDDRFFDRFCQDITEFVQKLCP